MARRNKSLGPSVSLFPFLSILACVIGTLTLMIAAVAVGQLDTKTVVDVERYEESKQTLETERGRIAALERQMTATKQARSQQQQELDRALADLDRYRKDAAQLRDQPQSLAEVPRVDRKKFEERLRTLEMELQGSREQAELLQQQIAQRGEPEEAVVQVQPGGSGVSLDPTFVECAATSVVILQKNGNRRIRRQDLRADVGFLALLDQIAQRPQSTLVFLIRDDGLDTYAAARALAQSRYARNGKLPVLGHGKIDVSLLEKTQ